MNFIEDCLERIEKIKDLMLQNDFYCCSIYKELQEMKEVLKKARGDGRILAKINQKKGK